jgi:hypothetical protein
LQPPYRKPADGQQSRSRAALDARIEKVLAQVFSVSVDFVIDDALAQSGKEWAVFRDCGEALKRDEMRSD